MSGLTPDELRELRRIHVLAGRRVDSLLAGDYRSAVRGRGMEFEEVRGYVPGDDIRHIDWNVTARAGEPFIKVFREERQMTVQLVVDVSGSTRIGSGGPDGMTDRHRQMARIAGGIAYAGIRNRDRVGLTTFTEQVETYLAPRAKRGHVWAVIQAVFEAKSQQRGTDLESVISFISRTQKRRAVIVLVSDFLDERPWDRALARLARKHTVHAVMVTDPLDEGLRGLGLVEFVDAETGQTWTADASNMKTPWSVDARMKRLQRAGARSVGISTEDDPYAALARHFQGLGRR